VFNKFSNSGCCCCCCCCCYFIFFGWQVILSQEGIHQWCTGITVVLLHAHARSLQEVHNKFSHSGYCCCCCFMLFGWHEQITLWWK
jgi:hypothetical protein